MFAWQAHAPDAPAAQTWDAIIAGGGLGGAITALELARRGWRVLVLERGAPINAWEPPPRRPLRLQSLLGGAHEAEHALAAGRWPAAFDLRLDGRRLRQSMPLGNGPGGSSALYAATLERFHREDFDPGGEPAPDMRPFSTGWPIPYDDMLPYYRKAEALFRVVGERDPSDPHDDFVSAAGPPSSERDLHFRDLFERAGLAPHRMRLALSYLPGCAECAGRVCPRDCKGDGATRALKPALVDHGAALLTDCTVDRLTMSGDRVTGVECRRGDELLRLRSRVVVLAAGALATPALLLRSTGPAWPNGVGNAAGLIGRGLMFHALQILALWAPPHLSKIGAARPLSARGANLVDGQRLGGLQSFAQRVALENVRQYLQQLTQSVAAPLADSMRLPNFVAARVAAQAFRQASLFALLTQDFAYHENRVTLEAGCEAGVQIDYSAPPELRARAEALRRLFKRTLPTRRMAFLTFGATPNFGHACGTCRMASSPSEGATDACGRVFGTENLFINDGSLLPTSGATNPSLTIAANALRIAECVATTLETARGRHEPELA